MRGYKYIMPLLVFALFFSLAMEAAAANYVVSGAGTAAVNGTYAPDGTNGMGQPRWKHTSAGYYLHGDGTSLRWVLNFNSVTPMLMIRYVNTSQSPFDASTPPETGWTTSGGASPAPTIGDAGPKISYRPDYFWESRADNGAIDTATPMTITHNNFGGETFTGSDGDDFVTDGKLVVTNLPSGLTVSATRVSSTQLSVTCSGVPDAGHEKTNAISDLTFTFQNTAFTGNDASAVADSARSDLRIFFNEWSLSLADASFQGEGASNFASVSLTGVGDVNGDGKDDFLIGAYGYGVYAGKTYLFLGKDSGLGMDTSLSAADASFLGENTYDFAGYSVSGAGDVNGDGFDDFLIGAYQNGEVGLHAGQTYLILGKAAADWGMNMSLSMADASFRGENADDLSGYSVSGAGDVNGDGKDDFLIGAYVNDESGGNAGQVYLILGKAFGWAMDTSLSAANASFLGEAISDEAGYSVSGAGDVNGDGYDDFLIGSKENDEGGNRAGQVYLILGKATGWSQNTNLGAVDASFLGEAANEWAGTMVSGAGDVNGDGFDDFLIGAIQNSEAGTYAGQTYLILGKAAGWARDTSLGLANASFLGEVANDQSGYRLSGAGDVNGDGFDDFLIVAWHNREAGYNAGQTYLILGKTAGWAMDTDLGVLDFSWWGEAAGDYAYAVSGAGDVNGDGSDDFLIGAKDNDEAGKDAGQAYLLFGRSPGPSVSAITRADANPTSAAFVDFTVTFSESVTGVDTTDFTLTLTGTASGTVAGVSGSGDTYTVTVNSVSGDGTLRLDLTDDDSITNGTQPLGGTGGNDYTSGESYTIDTTAPDTSITAQPANPDK